jgi:uncharacterized protein YgfB (UPF0149 family)
MNPAPSYGEIQAILPDRSDCDSAAEAHGLLAGLLCMDGGIGCGTWLERAFGPEADEPEPGGSDLLIRLHEETRRRLEDIQFTFEPLLPEDERPLGERAAALAEWCRGFLLGLGFGARGVPEWPGQCAEILRDFAEISHLDPAASGEADEAAYAELVEYVRVGAPIVQSELRAQTPPTIPLNP